MRHFIKQLLGTIALAGMSSSSTAWALPLGHPQDGAARSLAPAEDLLEALDVNFSATVALSNCSGAIVRFTTSQPDDKAMVLTNGHCLEGGMPRAGQVLVDRPSSRTVQLLTANGRGTLATLRAERLVYATMTSTDMALYRLSTTYDEIKTRYQVDALLMSDRRPEVGDPVRIVSGYWRRIYACSIAAFVPLLREDQWSFHDSIRYSQPGCATIGGTSGSPIIHADSYEVIGVNNTGNEGGRQCTMNNPCEVQADGTIRSLRGDAYGQQTYNVYSCLNDSNDLDLSLPGCTLPKPSAAAAD